MARVCQVTGKAPMVGNNVSCLLPDSPCVPAHRHPRGWQNNDCSNPCEGLELRGKRSR
ncbi:MAG: hypothetical protein EBX65_05990 [Betaproteobacteria bacterium]|nr:hypothetical protein [Betaproteobacteria bacterium]